MIKFLFTILFLLIFQVKAFAFELIMYDSKYCVYCKKFHDEVASDYNLPDLPLIIIDKNNQPNWFFKAIKKNEIKPIRGTPTFIIWNEIERYEVDRIVGYNDKDKFYNHLKNIFINFLNENKTTRKDLGS